MSPAANVRERDVPDLEKIDALVIFKPAGNLQEKPYLHVRFQHCFTYIKTGGTWRVVESTKECLIANCLVNVDIASILDVNKQQKALILAGQRPCQQKGKTQKYRPSNCVSVTKRMLKLNQLNCIITPLQLFMYLLLFGKMTLINWPIHQNR